ncbi:MAG: helix-turn-helix domain-containing protein [Heliobacteriaceae bacterium]|nr:helix-turn-helix domain-containing protein [Heliobacteriaceae bacterium]
MFYKDKKFVGNKVREYRLKMGLTQAELAEKAEVNENHISKPERGIYMPSVQTFLNIVDTLKN